jgi:hypothetical protein
MCTVTYIPTNDGFHLTSNRDEHISRGQAITPREYSGGKARLLYPKDPDKNGSWIMAKNNGDVVVLLNGAFDKHTRQISYRKSRGLVLMDIIRAEYPDQFYKVVDLNDIEPFTIVLYVAGKLYECRWDGVKKYITLLDSKKEYIWSSATLYDKMAMAKRNSWFNAWCRSVKAKNVAGILNFHNTGGLGDLKDGLVINRDGHMKTVSITNIHVLADKIDMTYQDLKDNMHYTSTLAIEPAAEPEPQQKAKPRFLALKRTFIKVFSWEYWPFKVVYSPIIYYWIWLGLKSRSFFFFNTANPLIENGGFAMESKGLIAKLIPEKYSPKTILFRAGTSIGQINATIMEQELNFPLIVKPDIGMRGIQVKKVSTNSELADYVNNTRVDFLIQEYIKYGNEVGIFYYRIPGEEKGHISGIVGKEFLTVIGDGKSTIEELIIKEPRYLLQLPTLRTTHSQILPQVLPGGESYTLVPYGNHARGAKFIDLSHLISEKLTNTIDRVCREIPEFYFGRMDVMYNNWEDLCEGKNFSIVELNGAGSEPTHIYDPKHSVFFAWKEIIRHWKLLQKISQLNYQNKGLKYMSYREGMALLRNNSNYLKLVS